MCGIAGFTHFDRKPTSPALRRALQSLHHRGPDQSGYFESPSVSLGAVRLKVIDLAKGDQPMESDCGKCAIVFNGEIYNYRELRTELEELGHRFRSNCDTEVVLRAFLEWDVESFSRLRGMFAAAFWNEQARRLVLVRDRLGIKPLYYAPHGGNLFFGSELKAIFAHDQLPRRLSNKALGYYLSLNYIPAPLTLVEGIQKLSPGAWLECRNGRVVHGTYWRNTFRPENIGVQDAREELDSLLDQAVQEHLLADVPVGVWASGGLDSSTVLHYAAQHAPRQLDTFSISFHGRRCDESKYFRRMAEYYGTRHHELDLNCDLDLESAIHEIAYYSDEPSADAGALPVWFLSKMTARHVTVALSGEGADEIFGGYETYLADQYACRVRRLPRSLLRLCRAAADRLPVSDEKIGFEYKLKRFLAGCMLPADEAHFFWNGTFSRDEQLQLCLDHDPEPLHQLAANLSGVPSGEDVNRFLCIDQHFYLPDDILYKCDRMSMAHSLEVRPPFLDHRIVEFAARLPARLKLNGRKTKYLLRELMRRKLPVAVLSRRKEGLDIPAHDWIRGPLRPLLSEALSPEAVREAGLFSPARIQRLVEQHLSRKINIGYHLWGLLTLHLWIRRWNIQTHDTVVYEGDSVLSSAAG
ncbi:MAG: asparagine synthase (glutamine-hydrolyzing) [Acidobacteriaceae bacterium]|nr:asparagine synthase (glutamine-hydrolyzing) [Acidobacteriaceae bacterium]